MPSTAAAASAADNRQAVTPLAVAIFRLCNAAVMPGWLCLAIAPRWEHRDAVVSAGILVVAVFYIHGLLQPKQAGKGGGFSTLQGVVNIFRRSGVHVLSACWFHYLAFDLLAGWLVTCDAHAAGISHALVVPCLLMILMFGPSGVLAFATLKFAMTGRLLLQQQ